MLCIKSNFQCEVCGEYALLLNYGVLTCFPCRTFFRRNALRTKNFADCRYGGNCEVNLITRKLCPHCRLKKCFAVGMNKSLIRKEELLSQKPNVTSQNRELVVMKTSRIYALGRSLGESMLNPNITERTIISNVAHSFDKFIPVHELKRTIHEFTELSPTTQYTPLQTVQYMVSVYHGMKSFIGSIPDFKVLTSFEQSSLFQRNLIGLLFAGLTCCVYETGMFDKPENAFVFTALYGQEMTRRAEPVFCRIHNNALLLKLLLVTLVFSPNCFMVHYDGNNARDSLLSGTFRLFGSQNVYVEILWKYLVHEYGFNDAVLIFSKMIHQMLNIFSIAIDLSTMNRIHQTLLNEMICQMQRFSVGDAETAVPLWGK